MAEREFRVLVHEEDGSYRAGVDGLPERSASGANLDELRAAVVEAITLWLTDGEGATGARHPAGAGRVDEMRVLVSG